MRFCAVLAIAGLLVANGAAGQDTDTDGDGLSDAIEIALGTNPLNPDTDGDGADDGNEVGGGTDPLDPASFPDEDADGTTDQQDNCLALSNPSQEDTDENGTGDDCNDAEDLDGDEWADNLDNCPSLSNADQTDINENGVGDKCDADLDTDGLVGQGTFGPQQVITTAATSARSVYAADLDGDGDVDVLSASTSGDNIAWYENTDGRGSFGPQKVITAIADGARCVYAADLDGDGDMDVLSASTSGDNIAWYENTDGMGTFGAQLVITSDADGARSVHAADLDGDGDIDVLSTSFSESRIAWYENTDGMGSFNAPLVTRNVITSTANGLQSVYAADLDGDGDMDVLSASESDDNIAWYENTDGMGTFGAQLVITSDADGARSVHAADLDGDGDIDVLSASSARSSNTAVDKIAWYRNTDALGTFSEENVITTAADGVSVYAADLDGDGDLDVLSASFTDSQIAFYENTDGAGSFSAQKVVTTAARGPESVYAADLDGDGDIDMLSASRFDDKIAWYKNVGLDNCPSDFNPEQVDTDGDGLGDACNDAEDHDGDEWVDALDNCPADFNPDQADTDGNGLADACNSGEDLDGDDWADGLDNCPSAANPSQADTDSNGLGDRCNGGEDLDGDDWADGLDNCPAIANGDQTNTDGDARGDVCDPFPSDSSEDSDTDGDGTGDNADLDDDGDGLSDAIEIALGTNPLNPDTDGDGFSDGNEVAAGTDPLDVESVPIPEPAPVLLEVAVFLTLLWMKRARVVGTTANQPQRFGRRRFS